jgi:hypothetical protein
MILFSAHKKYLLHIYATPKRKIKKKWCFSSKGTTIWLEGGGYGFFLKKIILIPNVAEKNILILVEEKKNNLIQSFQCHII